MPDASYVQASFLGGEWSKTFQGRYDRPDYRTGMTLCYNVIPIEAGAAVRRPGTRHAGTTRGGAAGRGLTFDIKSSTPYTPELTDGHLRMRSGYTLVTTNDQQSVSAISSANPAEVTTGTHGWSTNDQGYFSGYGSGVPLLHNRQFIITVTSSTKFTIADAITGATINGATLGSVPAGLKFNRILDLATPYSSSAWASIKTVQAEMTSIFLQGSVKPYLLTATAAPSASSYATFTFAPQDFTDGPYLDPVTGSWVTLSARSGLVTMTLTFQTYDSTVAYSIGDRVTYSGTAYQSITGGNQNNQPDTHAANWTAVSQGLAVGASGFQAGDIGRHVRFFSEPADWDNNHTYVGGELVKYNSTYWISTGGSQGRIPGVSTSASGPQAFWLPSATGAQWTWGKIVSVGAPISGTLAGSANIGNMTQEGGLAGAFNGTVSQPSSASAAKINFTGAAYVGKNYSGASAQRVSSVVVYPSNNQNFTNGTSQFLTFKLYAKQTLPANSSDGTLLGSQVNVVPSYSLVTIASSDTTTAWNYVWVEITPSAQDGHAILYIGQLQIYNPSSANSTQVSVQIVGPAIPTTSSTTIKTWRLGVYSDAAGWPICGTYQEGRLWLAGSIGNRIDASRSNDLFNFAPTETTGTVTDSNGITYTFNSKDVNTIYWMIQDQQGIICGTQAGEWLVQAPGQGAMSPTNIKATRVTNFKCANIEPRRTEHTIAAVQLYGRKVMEFFADVFSGKFSAPNLSEKSKHLTETGIEELAYQQELAPIIWQRRGDGRLIGTTYKRDSLMSSQGPTFAAAHQHDLGSGRLVESICTGPSTDGTLDSLTLVTNDTGSGIRHVEVMTNILDETQGLTDAWYLDDGIVPTSYSVVGATLVMTGLWPHNGKTVSVWAGGLDAGDAVVANGSVTVALTSDLTSTYIASFSGAMPIVVGFNYTSKGQIVRPHTPQESGTRNGPAFGKLRRSEWIAMQFVNAKGVRIGTDFNRMVTCNFRTDGDRPYTALELFNGIFRDAVKDNSTFDSQPCWDVRRPYPCDVIAIGGFPQTQDV